MTSKHRIAAWSAVVALVVASLALPALIPWATNRFELSILVNGMSIAIHEFVCSVFAAVALWASFRKRPWPVWVKLFCLALASVAVGDLMYGVTSYIIRTPPPRGLEPLVHEIPYALFALGLAGALVSRAIEKTTRLEKRIIVGVIAIIGAACLVVSYKLILNPFFHAVPKRPFPIYVTAVLYALGQSVFVGGMVVASFRALGAAEYLIWFCLLTLTGSDFVLRYQDIWGSITGVPFSEYGWQVALAGVAAVSGVEWFRARLHKIAEAPAPLYSVRVMTAGVAFVALFAFVVSSWWLSSFFGVVTPGGAGFHVTVFVMIWSGSNVLSIVLSAMLRDLYQKMVCHRDQTDAGKANMLWEAANVFRLLKERNRELKTERDTVLRITSTVAHNLRTPLQSMKTAVSRLESTMDVGPTGTKALEILRLASKNIEGIANEVLQERKNLQYAETIASAADGAVRIVSQTYPGKRFVLDLEDGLPVQRVRGLTPVLMNLLSNSAEATVGDRPVVVRARIRDGSCVIEVVDEGQGMAADLLEAIRRGEIRSTKKAGNGLGLSSAMKWATDSGYVLDVASVAGKGTAISLSIPN